MSAPPRHFRVGLLIVLVIALAATIAPLAVSAAQNIFINSKQIIDIQIGNTKIDQVYIGSKLTWQRYALTGDYIQTVTTSNCPIARTRVVDARDNSTYWVQKMADGRCWMLTNLAYGGGGTNTYNDVKTIANRNALSYTTPYYMIPSGANRTTGTTNPSASTTGIGQYGYLYNWCAAMGNQTGTSACTNALTPLPNTNISICPAGWKIPTSGTNGELQQLTNAIGATTDGESIGEIGVSAIRSTWLGMYSGNYFGSFGNQNSGAYYWSSTQHSTTSYFGHYMHFRSEGVWPFGNSDKRYGAVIRCLAV